MAKAEILTLDTSDVNRRLGEQARRVPGAADKLLGQTALAVERAAKEKAPIDTGALRASGGAKWHKGGDEPPTEHTGTTADGKSATVGIPRFETDPKSGEAFVFFTMGYAAAQHEGDELHHPQGGEAKFLEHALQEVAEQGMVEKIASALFGELAGE